MKTPTGYGRIHFSDSKTHSIDRVFPLHAPNGTHRAKAISATPLDDIFGVGTARKCALLAHFGSSKAVSRVAIPDLMAVEGISEPMAQKISDYFNSKN